MYSSFLPQKILHRLIISFESLERLTSHASPPSQIIPNATLTLAEYGNLLYKMY